MRGKCHAGVPASLKGYAEYATEPGPQATRTAGQKIPGGFDTTKKKCDVPGHVRSARREPSEEGMPN